MATCPPLVATKHTKHYVFLRSWRLGRGPENLTIPRKFWGCDIQGRRLYRWLVRMEQWFPNHLGGRIQVLYFIPNLCRSTTNMVQTMELFLAAEQANYEVRCMA